MTEKDSMHQEQQDKDDNGGNGDWVDPSPQLLIDYII